MRSWRKSAVADRHIALGSKLEDWNGMGTAWTYDADISKEYMAIRTAAGLMDVSGLKKPPGDTLWELGLDFTFSPGEDRA